MKIMKVIFMIAITMAITIALTMHSIGRESVHKVETSSDEFPAVEPAGLLPKRASRFLVENDYKNARGPADHCNKDNEICYIQGFKNSTCCNNKCMDLTEDKHNCGACKNKCKFMDSCCRGECVNLSYDKRNCGSCGNKCMTGGYCIYGLCNYA